MCQVWRGKFENVATIQFLALRFRVEADADSSEKIVGVTIDNNNRFGELLHFPTITTTTKTTAEENQLFSPDVHSDEDDNNGRYKHTAENSNDVHHVIGLRRMICTD